MFLSRLVYVGVITYHVYGGGGILSGFLHPILGLDHLLAMLAIGFISAQIGGRAIWTVPTAFVVVMCLGAILGIVGLEVPIIEIGITGSVVVLGIGIVANRELPEWVGILIAALFGFFHGHAHGTELPALTDTAGLVVAYIAGFLIATAGLHVIGALLGIIAMRSERGLTVIRVLGGLIALVGVFLFIGVLTG